MKNNKHEVMAVLSVTSMAVVALLFSLAWPGLKAKAASAYIWATAGVFTNTDHTFASDARINGCDPGANYQLGHAGPGGSPMYSAYGNSGCVEIPSGSTITEAGGVVGSAVNSSITTNGVGASFYGFAGGDGVSGASDDQRVRIWGINPLVSDLGHNHVEMLNEFDFNITGPDTKVIGGTFVGASTHQLAPGSAGWILGRLGVDSTGHDIGWTYGYLCGDGSAVVCFQAGPQTTGNNVSSSVFRFISRDSGGNIHFDDMTLEPGGDLRITPFGGNSVWINKNGTIKTKGIVTY